jgi:hypothetical protein
MSAQKAMLPSFQFWMVQERKLSEVLHMHMPSHVRAGLSVNFGLGMLHLSKPNLGKHFFYWISIKGAAQCFLQLYLNEK